MIKDGKDYKEVAMCDTPGCNRQCGKNHWKKDYTPAIHYPDKYQFICPFGLECKHFHKDPYDGKHRCKYIHECRWGTACTRVGCPYDHPTGYTAPIDEAPIEEAPIEEAPIDEAPIEEAPIDGAPIDGAPTEAPTEAPTKAPTEAPTEAKGALNDVASNDVASLDDPVDALTEQLTSIQISTPTIPRDYLPNEFACLYMYIAEWHPGGIKGKEMGDFYWWNPNCKKVVSSYKLRQIATNYPHSFVFRPHQHKPLIRLDIIKHS